MNYFQQNSAPLDLHLCVPVLSSVDKLDSKLILGSLFSSVVLIPCVKSSTVSFVTSTILFSYICIKLTLARKLLHLRLQAVMNS
jgi:hypothetical protein